MAQKPDLSLYKTHEEKVQRWLGYCEWLKAGSGNDAMTVRQNMAPAAEEGLQLISADDLPAKARFLAYKALGFYYRQDIEADSVSYYYLESLDLAKKVNDVSLIVSDCVALLHIGYEDEKEDKGNRLKDMLQSIIDTSSNQQILQDGYAALGSYFQQKAFYSSAQDYFIKSIVLKKQQADTTSINRIKNDYANQCYALAKLYLNTGSPDKALDILYEGKTSAAVTALTHGRYEALFIEIFCRKEKIDSALDHLHRYIDPLEKQFSKAPIVPAEVVFSNLAIAEYYINAKHYDSAFSYLDKGYKLSAKSKEPLFEYRGQKLMARYLLETGNAAKAIPLLNKALPVAKQFSKEDDADLLKYMALAQTAVGNKDAALQYYAAYTDLLDTLTKEKISRNFADLETHYQTNIKQNTITALDKENKLKKLELQTASRTKLLLIIGLVAVGLLALLLYFVYRNREKVNSLLHMQNNQLERLNSELGTANNTKAKLFSIISHDLRSPISQIIQLLQLQKENPMLISEAAKAAHDIRLKAASENVLETMEDMLLWSKSQMEYFKPQLTTVNIYLLIRNALAFINSEAEQKNISINMEAVENFSLQTDENFVAVIIRNLLQNALKYSNAGTEIKIAAADKKISFTNSSSVADADLLNAQLNNKNIDSNRSGLGLQIVSDLATAIGIHVFFQKEETGKLTAVMEWTD
ncbi:MAG: ATP-binding protein [Ferruginibacter sp.]